ncbi:MAG: hypothetical protein QF789_07625 [Gammaproteobacteria bacterium]|nr:hypothetical protein [Gammaproteobacteria bacterium]
MIVRILIFAALLAGICTVKPAAAELSIKPYIKGGVRYDSNPRYQENSVDYESKWGAIYEARLPIEYRSQRTELSLTPRIIYSSYPDAEDHDLEDRDKYLTGTASRDSRQAKFGASYGHTDLSLRTSEFESAGDSSPGGSGETRFFANDSQERWFFQPYWYYQLSPASVLSLNGGYQQISYDEELVSKRFDYDYSNVSAAFQHTLDNRHAVSLQAQFAKFDAKNAELGSANNSETNSLNFVYTYTWSETAEVSADLGWARTKNQVRQPNDIDPLTGPYCNPVFIVFFPCEFKSDATNLVGNLTATQKSESTEYKIVLGQSITPNSNGAEVVRFNLNATVDRRFSEHLYGKFGIIAFTQKNAGNTNQNFDRDYIRGNVWLGYRFAREWWIYAAYTVTSSDTRDNLSIDWKMQMHNHTALMGIRFQSDGWRW